MSGALPCDSEEGQRRARHLGLMVMSRMVIGVLLTMAPLASIPHLQPALESLHVFLLDDLPAVLGEREPEGVGADPAGR